MAEQREIDPDKPVADVIKDLLLTTLPAELRAPRLSSPIVLLNTLIYKRASASDVASYPNARKTSLQEMSS